MRNLIYWCAGIFLLIKYLKRKHKTTIILYVPQKSVHDMKMLRISSVKWLIFFTRDLARAHINLQTVARSVFAGNLFKLYLSSTNEY